MKQDSVSQPEAALLQPLEDGTLAVLAPLAVDGRVLSRDSRLGPQAWLTAAPAPRACLPPRGAPWVWPPRSSPICVLGAVTLIACLWWES